MGTADKFGKVVGYMSCLFLFCLVVVESEDNLAGTNQLLSDHALVMLKSSSHFGRQNGSIILR